VRKQSGETSIMEDRFANNARVVRQPQRINALHPGAE
jgi:hypothetical protein